MEYRLQSMYNHMVGWAATAVFNTPWLFQMMLHAMPDSQWYSYYIYLINNVEDIVVFLIVKRVYF